MVIEILHLLSSLWNVAQPGRRSSRHGRRCRTALSDANRARRSTILQPSDISRGFRDGDKCGISSRRHESTNSRDWIIMARTFIRTYHNTWPYGPTQAAAKPTQCGDFVVSPVMVNGEHAFGAEVSGVDWSQPVPEETAQQVSPVS